jgi:phosphoribosylglycinamide formyltransferase 2
VILADRESEDFGFEGVADALALGSEAGQVDIRIFGKPVTRKNRRMGVALATGATADEARALAVRAAASLRLVYPRETRPT